MTLDAQQHANPVVTKSSKPVAVVTGANRGIGAEVARQLAALGFHLVLAVRTPAKSETLLAELTAAGHSAEIFALDVCSQVDAKALAAHLTSTYGRLDVLINNAGVALDQWVSGFEVDLDIVRKTLDTNLLGVLNCCQQLMPLMRSQGYGRVVNVSSELASLYKMEMGTTLAYRMSKTAVNAVTKLLALELPVEEDVLINAACPGWVKTELGGPDAPRSVQEGADTIIWLATLPASKTNGDLYRDRQPYPW